MGLPVDLGGQRYINFYVKPNTNFLKSKIILSFCDSLRIMWFGYAGGTV